MKQKSLVKRFPTLAAALAVVLLAALLLGARAVAVNVKAKAGDVQVSISQTAAAEVQLPNCCG